MCNGYIFIIIIIALGIEKIHFSTFKNIWRGVLWEREIIKMNRFINNFN